MKSSNDFDTIFDTAIEQKPIEQKNDTMVVDEFDSIFESATTKSEYIEEVHEPTQKIHLEDINKTLEFPSKMPEEEISYNIDKFYSSEQKKNVFQQAVENTSSGLPVIGKYLPKLIESVPKEAKEYAQITKERWRKGYENPNNGLNWGQLMMQEKTLGQTKSDSEIIKKQYSKYKAKDYNFREDPLKHLWSKGVEMAPFMWESSLRGAKGAMEGSIAGGLAGLVVGGVDPTDIGFVALGAKVGAIYETLDYTMRVEGGGVMEDLINSGVSESTARSVAIPSGLISGGIELLQLDMLVTSPLRRMAAKKIISHPSVKKAITMGIKNYLKTYFTEIGEEGLQKMTTETFKTLGEYIDGKIPQKEMNAKGIAKRILKDVPNELKEAAKGMVFFPVGSAIQVTASGVSQANQKKTVAENRAEVIQDRDELETALDEAEQVVDEIVKETEAKPEEVIMPEEEVQAQQPQEEPLVAEAKKYKTAEEFVNAQGEVLYHQSQSKEDFSTFRQKGDEGYKKAYFSQAGEGIYFSSNKDLVQSKYGKDGGILKEVVITPKKTLDLGEFDAMYFDGKKMDEGDIVVENFKRSQKNEEPLSEPDIVLTNISKKAKKWLLEQGYDSVTGMKGEMWSAPETVVLDPSIIKTKSQLEAEWNKANKAQGDTTTTEKKKTTEAKDIIDYTKQGFSKHYEKVKKEYGFSEEGETYDKIQLKDQEKRAFNYAQKNPDKAMRIAYGVEEAPVKINKEAIATVVMKALSASGKVAQAEDIARRLSKSYSEAAQTLNIAKLNVNNGTKIRHNITTKRINAIGEKLGDVKNPQEAVKQEVEKRAKKRAQSVSNSMNNQQTTIQEIDSLIEELIC